MFDFVSEVSNINQSFSKCWAGVTLDLNCLIYTGMSIKAILGIKGIKFCGHLIEVKI